MTEIFTHLPIKVIQGEGMYTGISTTLIRFGKCNLRCNFCDIKANWTADLKLTIYDLIYYIEDRKTNLLFTGGEPLLNYHRQLFIEEVIQYFNNNNIIEIETNGLNNVEREYLINRCHFNISPKENRYQLKGYEIKEYELLKNIKNLKSYIVKFVFDDSEETKKFIFDLIEKYDIPNKKVYIMPKGDTTEECMSYLYKAIDFAIANNFNISPRLHIMLNIAKYLNEV